LVRPLDEVASVYIGLDPADLSVRWRRLETELLAQGAPPETVGLLDGYLRLLPGQPKELAMFASAGRLLWHLDTPGGVRFDRAAYGAPAMVLPLVAWLAGLPAYVEVVLDRAGAEITTVPHGASAGKTVTVAGPDDEIGRGGPRHGDHPKIERRAVSSWRHNAGAVANAVAAALKRVDAELLLVAGQPRIVRLMLEQLPKGVHPEVRRIPGGRGRDGSGPGRRRAAAEAVADFAARHHRVPADGVTVLGAADTLRALTAGEVRRLYVVDDPADTRIAWFGPGMLATDTPGEGLIGGRLADVAARAALLTDADVWAVEPGRAGPDGIGALLRFP
jgi:hypothetical protein